MESHAIQGFPCPILTLCIP